MSQGFYGFPNILGIVRATTFKAIGKTGATNGAALAGGTPSGAPVAPAGPFDVGDIISDATGKLWICTTAGTSQSSPGSFTQVGGTTSPLSTKGDVWVYGSSDSRLGVGSNDQVLIADSAQSLGVRWGAAPAGAGGALTQIAQSVLSGSAASITLSSIPGSYSSLLLALNVRTDAAGVNFIGLYMQLNADTAANYDATWTGFGNGGAASSSLVGQAQIQLALTSGNVSPASSSGSVTAFLHNYAATTLQKTMVGESTFAYDNTLGIYQYNVAGRWRSTAAITSIKVYPASGNFVAGTVATLYGAS